MKITDFRLEKYQQIMDRPLCDSNGPSGDDLINSSILWINTDEGISGQAPMGNDYVENLFPLIQFKILLRQILILGLPACITLYLLLT